MMRRMGKIVVLFLVMFLRYPAELYAQYGQAYQLYMGYAKEAIARKDYTTACEHLMTAYSLNPASEEPLQYLNYVKRLEQQRVSPVGPPAVIAPAQKTAAPSSFGQARRETVDVEPVVVSRMQMSKPVARSAATGPGEKKVPRVINLDDGLWSRQPDTLIEIELGDSIVLEGPGIKRFLVVTAGALAVQQPSGRQLVLSAIRRGATFFHVWQNDRRWTFRVNTIFPLVLANEARASAVRWEEKAKPFKFVYINDWDGYYRGPSMDALDRRSLSFQQWLGVWGDTPYGKFDSSVNFYKFIESTEATGYTVGLTDGQIGDFKDFSLRAFDASKHLSDLTVPGRYFRGEMLEAYAFDHKIYYVLLQGQDRAIFNYLSSPGGAEVRRSYIEAGKLAFLPTDDQTYAFNYARGYGEARPKEFKDKVYSLEAKKILDGLTLSSEIAHDDNTLAYHLRSEYREEFWRASWKFRDVNKEFYTISGAPAGQGEVGAQMNYLWDRGDVKVDSFLDLYRDRLILNREHPDAVNVDFSTNVSIPLPETAAWRSSFYYTDTPGLVTTRRDVRLGNTYSNTWDLWGVRQIAYYCGQTYQRSRSSTTPGAEFDRHSVNVGFRIPLIGRLSHFLNYEYSWVQDLAADESGQPRVLTTGLNYTQKIVGALFGSTGLIYRDEEKTEGARSFLAGEDSLSASLGLTYRPSMDFEIFADSRMRNIWAENPNREPYTEADIRFGVKSSWDLLFSWSPSGVVEGTIFKDGNGNGLKEQGEAGIPDVRVKVGDQTVVTNTHGRYQRKVRAKKVLVAVDASSIPDGYVFSRQVTQEVFIEQGRKNLADFGLTVNSGIYGVVYFDKNQDGQIDPDDLFLPRVRLVLDGQRTAYTDTEGAYTFSDIKPGQHQLVIDLRSIPLDYLPLVKLDQIIEVGEGMTYIFHVPLRRK